MSKQKAIWMNPPLERLKEQIDSKGIGKRAGRSGGFSAKLGDIVGRYELLMNATPVPDLTNVEKMILGEVVIGSALSAGGDYGSPALTALRFMPESVMDCITGTPSERSDLRDKVASWSPAERMAVIESLGV